MNQQQYEAAHTILEFSRLFADAMRRAMENAGLLDEDFELHISVEKLELDYDPENPILADVELCRHVLRNPDFMKDRMMQFEYFQKGWVVSADPVVKCGSVPPTVGIEKKASGVFGSGEKAEKPTPPDGLWVSVHDDYPPVDRGV